MHTAFLEYVLSSTSVRASTNKRLRFGRFAYDMLEFRAISIEKLEYYHDFLNCNLQLSNC